MSAVSRIALVCALSLGAVALSAAAQDTQPNIRMARELVVDASAFETYTRTAGAIDAAFAGPKDVAGAVHVAAAHDPQQIEAGMIAYAAMAALQDPAFVAGVRRIAADPAARETLVRELTDNPDEARALPGADTAAARARSALLRQIEPLLADGRRVKQAAYDIQHQEWSKAMVGDARERLAMVKRLAEQPLSPADADAEHLIHAVSVQDPSVQVEGRAAGPPSPVVLRGLALAALALVGRTGEEDAPALRTLVSDVGSRSCMHMAKLNLFQCMAVAGPHYEDVFCISQHAMLEAGQCMAHAAGADAPPASMQTADVGGVAIPIAGSR